MHSVNLSQAVGMNWPTPSANNFEQENIAALLARHERVKESAGNGNGFGLTTGNAVKIEGHTGVLNPEWEEPLMSWPIGWTQLEPLPVLNWPFRDRGAFVAKRGLPQHEWEPPRTCGKIPNRNARVRAVGNGHDPSALVLAWKMLNRMIVRR